MGEAKNSFICLIKGKKVFTRVRKNFEFH